MDATHIACLYGARIEADANATLLRRCATTPARCGPLCRRASGRKGNTPAPRYGQTEAFTFVPLQTQSRTISSNAPKIGLSYTGPARRAARAGSGREWIINDRTPDRHGTIIEPGGVRLENYRANSVVLFNHDHARIVGTSTVRRDGGRLVATVDRWAEDAGGVRQKVQCGILRAASVGFRVLNRERGTGPDGKPVTRITDWELVEWSICAVGSNPSALKRSGEVGRLPKHAVRKLRAGGQRSGPGGGEEIMLTDAQVERLLRGELRADVEASRRVRRGRRAARRQNRHATGRGSAAGDVRRALPPEARPKSAR